MSLCLHHQQHPASPSVNTLSILRTTHLRRPWFWQYFQFRSQWFSGRASSTTASSDVNSKCKQLAHDSTTARVQHLNTATLHNEGIRKLLQQFSKQIEHFRKQCSIRWTKYKYVQEPYLLCLVRSSMDIVSSSRAFLLTIEAFFLYRCTNTCLFPCMLSQIVELQIPDNKAC
jgi:hypothetical protein